ncbi:MAG TPA: polyribonucleotide nucleotidyltransferase [Planctomycetota bacterium]|nr:polyribonucleotide nucleotidyltransferase [Planctomycetota bacterium]HRR80920.1 polyribonucleotide nucleotidyltransferase [Planctomycetota bacterium]HRT93862.1 polyribonucleotide nucleotidyltransferase [Planctomycetota bacterium]
MAIHRVERVIGDRPLIIETGKLAKQAEGAVTVRYGDTVVLSTVSCAEARRETDFFPLTVEYREKFHAAGKIPGGRFMKREGRPSRKEILTSRMCDRPLRPLFPKGFREEVMIHSIVLSADKDNDPDVLAMVGSSAALSISSIPFLGPLGAVRVGRIGGRFLINPTYKQVADGDLDLVMAASKDAIVMVEAGAKEIPESSVIEALRFGHDACRQIVEMIEELVRDCGVTARFFEAAGVPEDLKAKLNAKYRGPLQERLQIRAKRERGAAVIQLRQQAFEEFAQSETNEDGYPKGDVAAAFEELEGKVMRSLMASGTRCDGRGPKDIRPIACEVAVLPRAHGSALFTRGETQALVATTLGTSTDEEWVESLFEDYTRKFMLHYNFPGFSVGEVRPERGPGRREIGHGALAERAFEPVLPSCEDFPYTIRIVSEILESNGSSSMATVCGATLSMMDAGIPIRDPVAGIAMGLIKEGDKVAILTDILGDEDHFGDMDFKVAGTQHGVTALQMDIKIGGLSDSVMRAALEQAREARIHILREMLRTLDRPRHDISPYAPRLLRVQIDPAKIGTVIGPGGKMIRSIEAESGAKVEIEDSGVITIASPDVRAAERARDLILGLVATAEIGKVYNGRVVSTKNFGAFIEFLPGQEGLCHISELADRYVERVEDEVRVGDEVKVKVISIDDQGRVKLSRKAVGRDDGPPPSPNGGRR